MFWLKKVVSFYLMPLPVCLALLGLGLVIGRFAGRKRAARLLVAAGSVLFLLFSNRFVSTQLVRPLEARYPAIPEVSPGAGAPESLAGCTFVAVLGSGHTQTRGTPATSELSASGLARIVEAVRILRLVPGARLIVSGPGEPGRPSHAAVLAMAAASLGISPARITLIDTARDTEEESFAVASIVAGGRTALVTSAWHMPRAAHLFRRASVDIVPCPTDFAALGDIYLNWSDFGWDGVSLERSTMAVHEWIGLLWLRLRNA